ncbi:MAG: hypothetical protein IJ463_04380 [Bacilli bacterium]|nr:hypothetical protein [Bacilli bacterium]
MSKMTFMDKLSVLLNVSLSSKLFIALFILLIIIGIVLIKNNNNDVQKNKKIYLMITIFISALVIFTFNTSLAKMFDYMMNNLFIIVYFPNIAIYLAAIIATNVILFVSIFSNKTSKVIKNINIIVYTIINYLLVLLLFTVNKSGLDLFSQSSIYQNESATALIELTSILFIVWVVFLVLYKLILSYLSKDDEISEDTARIRKKILMEEQRKIFDEKRELEREKEELRKAQEEMTTPVVVREETPKQMSREEYMMKQFDQMLTLNDYKVLLNVLKEHRDKEKAEQERQQMIKNENVKYEELLSLYR